MFNQLHFIELATMNTQSKGGAKRLVFSLVVASALGGCAVYEPGYPGYAADPYAYGAPVYSGVPYYVGPPVSLGLWYGSRGGGYRGRGHYGHRGYHGHGGHDGGWGGRHR
ncbi:MAG: hypothetical protein JWR65_2950 [Massilia sp.]|nr:hypothetical protein [Massilia sp.]